MISQHLRQNWTSIYFEENLVDIFYEKLKKTAQTYKEASFNMNKNILEQKYRPGFLAENAGKCKFSLESSKKIFIPEIFRNPKFSHQEKIRSDKKEIL